MIRGGLSLAVPPRDAGVARDGGTWLAGLAFAGAAVAAAAYAGRWAIAVYALAFWHYALYAAAYRYGAIALPAFKRDAFTMKSLGLAALFTAYFAAPLDLGSLAVVGAGFGLNAVAAAALGGDRTYYGHEIAGLPHRRVTAFPYSLMRHPMLVGNMAAYAGLLLNAPFRERWWPLAAAHVALNLALLVMETQVRPLRRGPGVAWPRNRAMRVLAAWGAAGLALGTGAGMLAGAVAGAAFLGAGAGLYAGVIRLAYIPPRMHPTGVVTR